MLHHTLNTGHTRVSPRREVRNDVVATLRPMLAPGQHDLPGMEGYSVVVTPDGAGLLATVSRGQLPCVTFGVAATDEAAEPLWRELERFYLALGDQPGFRAADFLAPHRPKTTPWCAAVTVLGTAEELYWMADFERCLAWAWIESVNAKEES